jgi:hypothetical protein
MSGRYSEASLGLKTPHSPSGARKRAMLRPGKKVKAWAEARKRLKAEFEAAGVVTCELQWPGCWNDTALSFAHSLRRRYITSEEQLSEVLLACTHCHEKLDRLSHEETASIVREIIQRRNQ